MIFAIIIDTVVRYISTDSIRGSLYVIRRVSHGNAGADGLQHFNIVAAVAKGDGLLIFNVEIVQNFLYAHAFAAVSGNMSTARGHQEVILAPVTPFSNCACSSFRLPSISW